MFKKPSKNKSSLDGLKKRGFSVFKRPFKNAPSHKIKEILKSIEQLRFKKMSKLYIFICQLTRSLQHANIEEVRPTVQRR
jgi:hypothetical protein